MTKVVLVPVWRARAAMNVVAFDDLVNACMFLRLFGCCRCSQTCLSRGSLRSENRLFNRL